MIELNYKTKQDFLSIEQMKKLKKLGVDTSDSKYCIIEAILDKSTIFVTDKKWESLISNPEFFEYVCDTYTLSELLYKLPEWIGQDNYKGLTFLKDAPFYGFYYNTNDTSKEEIPYSEYPLTAAFNILVWCIERGYNYNNDISDK